MKSNYLHIKTILNLIVFVLFFNNLKLSSQVFSYTFTTCGVTGQNGPTQAQVNTAYLATSLNGSVTVAGGIQQFTVPAGGLWRIIAGGSGALGANAFGCRGHIVQGDYTLTPGQVIKILVGQKGTTGSSATGGGGGTYVTTNLNVPIIVGGGGGGYNSVPTSAIPQSDGSYGQAGQAGTGTAFGAGGVGGAGGIGSPSQCGGAGGGFNSNGTAGAACVGTGGVGFVNGGTGGGTCNNSVGGFGGGGGTHGNTGGGGGGTGRPAGPGAARTHGGTDRCL